MSPKVGDCCVAIAFFSDCPHCMWQVHDWVRRCVFRDIIGQAGFRGVPTGNIKPSKRVYGAPPANEQHLHGAAVGITVDNPPERKARGWGDRPAYTHYNTANRTILTSKG